MKFIKNIRNKIPNNWTNIFDSHRNRIKATTHKSVHTYPNRPNQSTTDPVFIPEYKRPNQTERRSNKIEPETNQNRYKYSNPEAESKVVNQFCVFFIIKENVRTKCPDLEVLCEYFENLVLDPSREEKEEQFDVKKILKKGYKKLRHGGATADHRAGGAPATTSISSPLT